MSEDNLKIISTIEQDRMTLIEVLFSSTPVVQKRNIYIQYPNFDS